MSGLVHGRNIGCLRQPGLRQHRGRFLIRSSARKWQEKDRGFGSCSDRTCPDIRSLQGQVPRRDNAQAETGTPVRCCRHDSRDMG